MISSKKDDMRILITIIANKPKNSNQIASTKDPPTRLNVLLDARTVLIHLPHNVGSGMMIPCREFGRV